MQCFSERFVVANPLVNCTLCKFYACQADGMICIPMLGIEILNMIFNSRNVMIGPLELSGKAAL